MARSTSDSDLITTSVEREPLVLIPRKLGSGGELQKLQKEHLLALGETAPLTGTMRGDGGVLNVSLTHAQDHRQEEDIDLTQDHRHREEIGGETALIPTRDLPHHEGIGIETIRLEGNTAVLLIRTAMEVTSDAESTSDYP